MRRLPALLLATALGATALGAVSAVPAATAAPAAVAASGSSTLLRGESHAPR